MISRRKNINMILESSQNWAAMKSGLLNGIKGQRRKVTDVVLENARRYLLNENATMGATASTNVAKIAKVMLPLLKRVMPTVMAYDFVGVQPISGPSAMITTIRYKYADNSPADGSGITAGQEALTPYLIGEWYSGNEDMAAPAGAATAVLEGVAGNRMAIEYLKAPVEVKSRKLSARFTMEAMQDAESQYGEDIESRITEGLASQITVDIDQEIIGRLFNLAGVARDTYDNDRTSGVATSIVDQHAALVSMLNRYSNDIGRRTRMGAANFAIVSSDVVSVLQDARASAFVRTTNGDFEAPTNNKSVGTLNGTLRLFVNTYAKDDTILLGYKGSDEASCAAIFCPYLPIVSSGVLMDPNTFENVMQLSTRYGWFQADNTATSLGNASDFVCKIKVANLRFY